MLMLSHGSPTKGELILTYQVEGKAEGRSR